jgi:hypoxanthine-DNA glycosylase
MERKQGFGPIFNSESRVLILGSFPSVKSRQIDFYYGNKQNRFWRTICGFFGEEIPETPQEKTVFLLKNKIAVWDMITACEVTGSSDASIKNEELANLEEVLSNAKIEKILLNGALSYNLFMRKYASLSEMAVKMPSTSPANPRFSMERWRAVLNDVFRVY